MNSNLAAGLAMIGAIGPGIGLGIGFSKAMEAIGRNPELLARCSCHTSLASPSPRQSASTASSWH